MGIFNFKIFKELGDSIKDIVNDNVQKDKPQSFKCSNCGAQISASSKKTVKCEYCGTENTNPNYSAISNIFKDDDDEKEGDVVTKQYFVLVQKLEDGGFTAYDAQTDTQSDVFDTVLEALDDIKKEIVDVIEEQIEDGELCFEFLTEEELLKDRAVQRAIKNGEKLKPIDITYHAPKNIDYDSDPNW